MSFNLRYATNFMMFALERITNATFVVRRGWISTHTNALMMGMLQFMLAVFTFACHAITASLNQHFWQ
jgi:hypothetical protein